MIIISGPSTIGKNPLIYKICEEYEYDFIVPVTTREIRREEESGKDYFFLSKELFQNKIKKHEIIEWDYVLDNYYGYIYDFSREQKKAITHGLSRMAVRIKQKYPDSVRTIFLMPQNIDVIMDRINKIYSGSMLELRKSLVEEEIEHARMFDYVFPVDDTSLDLLKKQSFRNIVR